MIIPKRQEEISVIVMEEIWPRVNRLFCRHKKLTHEEADWVEDQLNVAFPLWLLETNEEESEDMSKGVIVQRAADKAFDEKYLDIAIAERDSYMGYAFIEDGEISFGEMSLENKNEVKEQIKDTPNHPLIITFQMDVDTEESKQPFTTLTKEDGKPLCVCFMDGDLQGAPESSHSAAWTRHQEYLAPKIVEMFNDFGEDIDKVIEKLERATSRSEIANNCFVGALANGEVLLLFANGKTVNIIKGDKHKKYEWGEVSLAFGFEGKPTNPEKTEAVRKGLGGKASVPPTNSGKADSKVDPGKKPDTAIAAALDKAVDKVDKKKTNLDYMIVPPAHRFTTIQALESWYRAFTDAEHIPSTEELHKMKGNAHLAIPVKVKSTFTDEGLNKVLANKSVLLASSSKDKATEPKATIPMVIIPNSEREKLDKEFWPKIVSGDPKLVADPEELSKFLDGKPVASSQLGRQMGVREFETLTADGFAFIMKAAPETAKAMFVEMQHEIYKGHKALAKAAEIKKAM